MQTELSYLLEELDKWGDDTVIRVKDLKKMINKAFRKAELDDEIIDGSNDNDWN